MVKMRGSLQIGMRSDTKVSIHACFTVLLRRANWSVEEVTGHLGAVVAPQYHPGELLSNPPSPADVTLELLLASQAHLGHKTSLWNPGNAQYIYGTRDGIHIISLEVTAAHLRRAAKVVEGVTMRGGLILFVGTRKGQDTCVVRAAQLAGGCHLFQKWIPGSITNGQQILGSCTMKVVNERDEEIPGFEEQLKKRATLKPDLVVCLDPMQNWVLLNECALNNIPTIGIIDTNADPTWVTYPIPANDDRYATLATREPTSLTSDIAFVASK
jgi:small subunit ribosomal protein S2